MKGDKLGEVGDVFRNMGSERSIDQDGVATLSHSDESSVVRIMAMDVLQPNPYNHRKLFKGVEELAADIKERGILTPLLVTRAGGGNFRIIAGERRYRAAKLLGLKKAPCIIKEGTREELNIIGLVDNIKRRNLSGLEMYHAANDLVLSGMKQQEVADIFEVDKTMMSRWMATAKVWTELQSMGYFTWEEEDELADRLSPRIVSALVPLIESQDHRMAADAIREIVANELRFSEALNFISDIKSKALRGTDKAETRSLAGNEPQGESCELSPEPISHATEEETPAESSPDDQSQGEHLNDNSFSSDHENPPLESSGDQSTDVPGHSGEGPEAGSPVLSVPPPVKYDPMSWNEAKARENIIKPLKMAREKLSDVSSITYRVTNKKKLDEVISDIEDILSWLPECQESVSSVLDGLKALQTEASDR